MTIARAHRGYSTPGSPLFISGDMPSRAGASSALESHSTLSYSRVSYLPWSAPYLEVGEPLARATAVPAEDSKEGATKPPGARVKYRGNDISLSAWRSLARGAINKG